MDAEIIKIIAIAISGIILTGIVKNMKPEFTIYIVLAVSLVIFFLILDKLTAVFSFLNSIYESVNYGTTFFPVLLKVLVIAYITDITAQLARDAGEGAIAAKTELAGKILIFYISVPILAAILDLLNSIL